MGDLEPWERWKIVWQHAFFAVALGLGTLSAVVSGRHDFAAIAIRLGLVGAVAAWYGYWFAWATIRWERHERLGPARSHPGRIWRRPAGEVHLPYLIGVAVLWAVLAAVDPALLAVGVAALIPYCMRRPIWSAAAVVAVGTAWIGLDLIDGTLNWLAVVSCLVGAGTVLVIAGYIATLDREGRARQRLLDQLAAALAELAAAERHAGTLAERQRLARDIHDTLTQGFASIGMLLDAAQAHLQADHPAGKHVGRALEIARENLTESRRLVWALRPAPLDGARLADAVRALADRLEEETGIPTTTLVTGTSATLPPDVETGLLRVVQEALTNVRRHAAATEVAVTVSYMDDLVAIDVHDDGAGFLTDPPPAGIGLRAMRERVNELGGTLTIESNPGEGTTIAAAIPCTVHDSAAVQPAPYHQRTPDVRPTDGHLGEPDAIPTDGTAGAARRSRLPTR